jgi:hypothetical protein
MPIPVYDAPRVSTQPLPTPYRQGASPDAFGAAVGQGLQSAGAQLEQVALKQQHEQDLARVQEGQAAIGRWKTSNLYDAEKGYLAKRGQEAIGKSDDYLSDFDSTVEAISGSLGNDEQRRAFRAWAQEQYQGVSQQMEEHALRESDRAAAGAYEGALSAAASDAANAYTDPVVGARARHDGMLAVLARGKAQGWSPEETDAHLRTFTTTLHLAVAERMIASEDGLGAQRYLQQHGAEIDGTHRAAIDQQAEAAGIAQRGLAEARRIQSEAADPGKQLELARKIPDAQLQDATSARLQHDAAAAEHARDLVDAQRLGRTVQAIESGDPTWKYKADFLQMADDKKALAMERAMAVARQRRALNQEDRRAAAEARREQAAANQLAVQQLLGLPVDQQATVDLPTNFPGVDPLGLAQLGAHQRRAKDDIEKRLVPDRTQFDDRVKEALTGAGIEGKDEKAAVVYMNSWREQWYRDHAGKGPTHKDVEDAISGRLVKVKVEGTGFFTDDTTSLLEARGNPASARKGLKPQWTVDQVEAARGELAAIGRSTDDKTVERYLRTRFGLPQEAAAPAASAAPGAASQPETPGRSGSF